MASIEMEEIKKHVQGFLNQWVIKPSSSPCGSLIVLVPKKDDTWRMCIDYRALNKITVKNRYPLSRIDELLNQLKNVLDLHSGYHQVRVAQQDIWKTAFKTKQGLFEWMVMPFRLCNAPAMFIRVMNDLFRPFLDNFMLLYLDDILVYSRTWDEHSVNKWKHYLIGKETIIHTDHQPLQYLQSQTKLQQACHFRWVGFLQHFHLVIKYKKGDRNKIVDMLSRPPISAFVVLKNASLLLEGYAEQYANDNDFKGN
eukprot:PITA_16695